MNEFANFQKRGIELPPGCKDLIDVLQYKDRIYIPPTPTKIPPTPAKDCNPAEGLPNIEHYVLRLFQSSAKRRAVWINCFSSETPVTFGLIYTSKGSLHALMFMVAERESHVRGVLAAAGIRLTQDDAIPKEDESYARFIACPLPADAANAARLVSELLQNGYGLPTNVELEFRYLEKSSHP